MLNLAVTSFSHTETSTNNQAAERWNHSGFDQLQREEDQGVWHQIKNPKKQRVAAAEGDYKKTGHRNNAKWMNNNQEDDLSTRVSNEAKNGSKGTKKDRKPDRQLYSVREKRSDNQGQNCNNTRKTKTGNTVVPLLDVMKEAKDYAFDDDKSFVSNVSTAISERVKNVDEDRDENKERVMLTSSDQSSNISPINTEETRVLFSLCLGVEENFETIFIYEGEQDYENFLDEVCSRHGITERDALYFKINIVQMIIDAHSNPSLVEPLLNKLLNINYNILLSELEIEGDDASPLFYGEDDNSFTEDSMEDSC